jgi:hypothetical protein
MRADVGRKLKDMRHSLTGLGIERSTSEQQRSFLLDVITRFQEIVSQAMATSYGTHELFDKEKHSRLATIVRNRMDVFKTDMEEYGFEYQFIGEMSDELPVQPMERESEEEDGGIPVRKHMNVSEHSGAIDGILHEQEIVKKPSDDNILVWIGDQYRASRGFEVGTFQTSLLCTIMNRQSGKWAEFALGYVSDVIDIIHTFMLKVLEDICPDEQICDKLVSVLTDELSMRYREAIEHAQLVLDVERMNIMTLNDNFHEKLEETQNKKYIGLFD